MLADILRMKTHIVRAMRSTIHKRTTCVFHLIIMLMFQETTSVHIHLSMIEVVMPRPDHTYSQMGQATEEK